MTQSEQNSLANQSGYRDDPCNRCEREIHVLEPATGVDLGGGVEADGLTLCHDCAVSFVEWFEDGGSDE